MTQPFSIFPTDLLLHDLSALELRVLIALYSFHGKNTNTVWPSLDSLAEVAGISDRTTVSKVTSRLSEKGMLTKKKRGFTGGNCYELIVPELSNLDESSNLGESSKPNLDKTSNSNLDESSKCKEVTIEVTNEVLEIGSPSAHKQPNGTRLPVDWVIPADWIANAANLGVEHYQIFIEAEKFKDYWHSVAGAKGRKADWQATWRNWVRRSLENTQRNLSHAERKHAFAEHKARRDFSRATPQSF